MKKKAQIIFLSLLLILSLAACGGSSGSDSGGNSGGDTSSYLADVESSESSSWDGGGGADVPTVPVNTKIIYSADIALETTEFDSAEQAVSRIVQSLGGWFENRSIYQGGGYRSLRCTVRVPSESFTAFLEQAGQAANVTSRDEYAEDISEAYYDNESRLTTQRTKLERLQLLLSQADAMEDIITLESAISETELEIEHLTGSLRKYDSLVGYATITLRLSEVYRLSGDEAVTFGQRLASAFRIGLSKGVSGLEEICISFARNWFTIMVLALLLAAAALIFRWRGRKKKEVPPPPKPPKSEE